MLSDLPTAEEAGLRGFDVESWTGIVAPTGTPDAAIKRLYRETAALVDTPDMKDFILNQGAEAALMDPLAFGAYMDAGRAKWAKVIRTANVKLE